MIAFVYGLNEIVQCSQIPQDQYVKTLGDTEITIQDNLKHSERTSISLIYSLPIGAKVETNDKEFTLGESVAIESTDGLSCIWIGSGLFMFDKGDTITLEDGSESSANDKIFIEVGTHEQIEIFLDTQKHIKLVDPSKALAIQRQYDPGTNQDVNFLPENSKIKVTNLTMVLTKGSLLFIKKGTSLSLNSSDLNKLVAFHSRTSPSEEHSASESDDDFIDDEICSVDLNDDEMEAIRLRAGQSKRRSSSIKLKNIESALKKMKKSPLEKKKMRDESAVGVGMQTIEATSSEGEVGLYESSDNETDITDNFADESALIKSSSEVEGIKLRSMDDIFTSITDDKKPQDDAFLSQLGKRESVSKKSGKGARKSTARKPASTEKTGSTSASHGIPRQKGFSEIEPDLSESTPPDKSRTSPVFYVAFSLIGAVGFISLLIIVVYLFKRRSLKRKKKKSSKIEKEEYRAL